jgi:hypothetical protein
MPDQRDQADIQNRRQTVGVEKYKESVWPILLTQLTGSCAEQRQWLTSLGDISLNIIKPLPGEKITRTFSLRHQTTSSHTIKTVKVFLGTQELNLLNYRKTGWLNDISTISVPESIAPWTHELKLIVIDDQWYSDTKSIQVTLIDADTTPPYLMDTKVQIEQQADGTYKIALLFADESSTLREWTIEQNGTTIHSFKDNIAQFTVNSLDNQLSRVALDSANNKWTWVIDLKRYKVKTTNNTWSSATWSN